MSNDNSNDNRNDNRKNKRRELWKKTLNVILSGLEILTDNMTRESYEDYSHYLYRYMPDAEDAKKRWLIQNDKYEYPEVFNDFEDIYSKYINTSKWIEYMDDDESSLQERWDRMLCLVPYYSKNDIENFNGYHIQLLSPAGAIIGDNTYPANSRRPDNLENMVKYPEVRLALTHGTYLIRRCTEKGTNEFCMAIAVINREGTPIITRIVKHYPKTTNNE